MRDVSIIYELAVEQERVLLRVFADIDPQKRAMGRFGGFCVEHFGSPTGAGVRQGLGRLSRALAALPSAPSPLSEALDAFEATVRATLPESALELRRILYDEQTISPWLPALRLSLPNVDKGLWPCAAERLGLKIGTRKLIKRELSSEAAMRAEIEELTSDGFLLRLCPEAPGQRQRVLLASLDQATLDEAVDVEAALRSSGEREVAAMRWMGEALGYPACCTEAYARQGQRSDVWLAALRLPPLLHSPAPAESQWLNDALRLISHAPCSIWCEETIQLGALLCEAQDQQRPGFASFWRNLAARVQVIDVEGRCLALVLDDELSNEPVIVDAIELRLPTYDGFEEVVRARPDLHGAPLVLEDARLPVARFGSHRATLIADHSG